MDKSSPRGGLVHALYLLMGSKLVHLWLECDSAHLIEMQGEKTKVV